MTPRPFSKTNTKNISMVEMRLKNPNGVISCRYVWNDKSQESRFLYRGVRSSRGGGGVFRRDDVIGEW